MEKNTLKTWFLKKIWFLLQKNLGIYCDLFSNIFQTKISNFGQKTADFTRFWQIKKEKKKDRNSPKLEKNGLVRPIKQGFFFAISYFKFIFHWSFCFVWFIIAYFAHWYLFIYLFLIHLFIGIFRFYLFTFIKFIYTR